MLVAINRPKTTPFSLLALHSGLLVSHLVLLIEAPSTLRPDGIAAGLGTFAALAAIASILNMPMRDPGLPKDEISPAHTAPDHRLRSPEDSLTLWQFMSVSWMGPLISLGSKRQLNDQDIWMLGYEFQHRRLHETFRELRGSVLRRVLRANWIDLMIVSLLGLLELLAGAVVQAKRVLKEAVAELENRLFDSCLVAATPPIYGRPSCTQTCCSHLRRFVPNCSTCCEPVINLQSLVR